MGAFNSTMLRYVVHFLIHSPGLRDNVRILRTKMCD